MRKYTYLLNLLIILFMTFVSCEKNDNEKEPDEKNTKTTTWAITQAMTKVELEGQTENDKELIEQIENEIMTKTISVGSVFIFIHDTKNSNIGEVIITSDNSQKENKFAFLFETTKDDISYLKIQDSGIETEVFQIKDNYLIKDFTNEYASTDSKIISALGISKFTILR